MPAREKRYLRCSKENIVSRRRTRFTECTKPRAETADDYAIYTTAANLALDSFIGRLTVVRKTDGRKLYPFQGAPAIGPFNSVQDAKDAALALGATIVEGDLRVREP